MKGVNPRLIINIILLIILLIFTGQNLAGVRVKFLFFSIELPLVILIAAVFFIGFFTAKAFDKSSKK